MRLARIAIGSKKPREITLRNSRVALHVWAGSTLFIAPSLFVWRNAPALIAIALLFCLGNVWLNFRLPRWRAPAWLI